MKMQVCDRTEDDLARKLSRAQRGYLSMCAKGRRGNYQAVSRHREVPVLRYASAEEMVLFAGEEITAFVDSTHLPSMRPGNCFGNAFEVALQDPTMRYYEGYAMMANSIPTHHGWLVDTDGNVHDPTWAGLAAGWGVSNHLCVYLGVHVPISQQVGWFWSNGLPNVLANGDMDHACVLEHGLAAFEPFAVEDYDVAAILRQLNEHGRWTLDKETGIFTHEDGRRWNGHTRAYC